MFATFQVFSAWKYPLLAYFRKRISFHFALPLVGLRAEVARRWWLSRWWRDPPRAWFSLITFIDRYRDMHIHTMPAHREEAAAVQKSYSLCALISGRLLSLTHCCAERGFGALTWWGLKRTPRKPLGCQGEADGDNEEALWAGAVLHLLSPLLKQAELCLFSKLGWVWRFILSYLWGLMDTLPFNT